MFHQMEGLYVAEKVSLADLKYDLQIFLSRFFERDIEALFRPSYFPFVEPGADVHIRWTQPDGSSRWLEVLGRSEEHTSELQSLMRISYAVYCLKKKKYNQQNSIISNKETTEEHITNTTRHIKP